MLLREKHNSAVIKNLSKLTQLLMLTFLFIHAGCFSSYSQTNKTEFVHLNPDNRLSQNGIATIFKDHKGIMWFGTDKGLFHFDGYEYKEHKSDFADKNTLSDYRVFDICEDKQGSLWFATFTGINRYNRASATFSRFFIIDKPRGFTDNFVLKVGVDNASVLWTKKVSSGLYFMNPGTKQFEHLSLDKKYAEDLLNNNIIDSYLDPSGSIWFCVNDKEKGSVLGNYNYKTKQLKTYRHNPADAESISNAAIRRIFKDSKGNLWIGLFSGIDKLDVRTGKFMHYKHKPSNPNSISDAKVLVMEEDNDGGIWIGTEGKGLDKLDPLSGNVTHFRHDAKDPKTLSSDIIYSLLNDKAGTLWVGTGKGLNTLTLRPKRFHNYLFASMNGIITNPSKINDISTAADGLIWYCTDSGIYKFDRQTDPKLVYKFANAGEIVHDKTGRLWVAGEDGFAYFDPVTKKSQRFYTNIIPDSFDIKVVWTIYADDHNILWMGTGGDGLKGINIKTNAEVVYKHDPGNANSISSGEIAVIARDRNKLWLGPFNAGLNCIDLKTGKVTRYIADPKNPGSLSFPIVTAIYIDKKGRLWAGTYDGLNLLEDDGQTFRRFTEKEGLANNSIRDQSIIEDKEGNIWVATMAGISRINGETFVINNYDARDGFQVNKEASMKQGTDGEIILFGINGITTFYPKNIKSNPIPPQVSISDFKIFNESVVPGEHSPLQTVIEEAKEITLSYKQSFFSIEFTAQNYLITEKNQFAYKLEGFENEWNYAGTRRIVYYTNVPPGEYRFRVKASNNDGVWNEEGKVLDIIITPPFWLTWWFKLLVAVAVIIGLAGVYKIRTRAIALQQLKLQQQVEEKTRQLLLSTQEEQKARRQAEQANIELERKNKELEQFAYVASHDLQEPLRMVSGFLTQLEKKYGDIIDDKGKRYIHFAVDGARRMRQIILDLLEFSRVGRTEKNCEEVDLNELLTDIQVLHSKKINEKNAIIRVEKLPLINGCKAPLRQVFQNLISNALKYSKHDVAPEISITAKDVINHWQFSVADNGIGIDPQYFESIFILFQRLHNRDEYSGTGIGLAITKKIVENMGGKIWVESAEGKGSTFYLIIPKQVQ